MKILNSYIYIYSKIVKYILIYKWISSILINRYSRRKLNSMQEVVKVAVDAMGGDNAPGEIVKGAIEAINKVNNIKVFLVGKEEVVNEELKKYTYNKEQLEVINASEVIATDEPPVMAIRRKKDSSLVKAMNMVKNQEADALVSAGSSGAILVGGQVIVGRIKGIERPPLAPLIPTANGVSLLVDCGANVDARASHLVQFAKLGSIYMENVIGIKKPKVAIVNIGAEEEKGNMLVKETFPLLKECKDINFIGSIEARDIPSGYADVIVCEAFVGNVILKLYEGVGLTLVSKIKSGMMSSFRSKIGALLVKPALKASLKSFDASEYGGAPLLGLNGLVVKTHGSSKAKEVTNSIIQCVTFKNQKINEKIKANIKTNILMKDE
jgi:glycerol-3-phosphate acyltransferase PlsX